MAGFEFPEQTDDEQIRRVLDQVATSEEFEVVARRLQTDAQFRRRYVILADQEAELSDVFSESTTLVSKSLTLKQTSPSSRTFRSWIAVSLIATVLAGFAWFGWKSQTETGTSTVQTQPIVSQSNDLSLAFTANNLRRTEDAAVVVRADNVVSVDLKVGTRLKAGVLKLPQGQVQLEFMNGAILALAGPAELSIESEDEATLVSGVASMRVPERARGFTLHAPDTAIVDLGTEFGVRIDKSGTSEVEVTSGEVQLSLLGDDGNTLLSQLVTESESFRIDGRSKQLVSIHRSDIPLPEITFADNKPLPVTDAYISAVVKQSPVLYWRFENEINGTLRNEVDERWSAVIHRADSSPECIKAVNGHVRFEYADAPRYLICDQSMPNLNIGPYSIEFWMKPDDLHRATCVGLFPDNRANIHLNVVEIATDTELVHEPGAIRFLHRNPPAKALELGTNVYTSGVCIPGQWQHVVAVKDGQTLQLYFNGQLAKHVETTKPNSDGEFRMIVGQLNLFQTERQFVGSIDEIALYQHALTPSVIQHHYQLIAGESNN